MVRKAASLLVVARGITSEFENSGSEVFEDGSEVGGNTRADRMSVVARHEGTTRATTTSGFSRVSSVDDTATSGEGCCVVGPAVGRRRGTKIWNEGVSEAGDFSKGTYLALRRASWNQNLR